MPETHPWHALLDDLAGYARYHAEIGDRALPGTPALLAALTAPAGAKPPQAPQPSAISLQPSAIPQPDPSEKIAALHAAIRSCARCPLSKTRKNAVPGEGNAKSPDILFIDESPAPEDDATGVAAAPGAHQDLLRKMIKAMGYEPGQVFITTLCKCLAPDNARPPAESLDACRPYIEAQINLLKPKVIVLLGAGATMGLLKKTAGSVAASSRGAWTRHNAIPTMPTYAPAHINKFPAVKPNVWNDLKIVMKFLGKSPPAR
ncbi:MAG: uracil-DNA glycosylase [Kiritimatiellaeota bacterium]|nr:uracil-DNA glycosylase [Kiritimatiellota bacterium]